MQERIAGAIRYWNPCIRAVAVVLLWSGSFGAVAQRSADPLFQEVIEVHRSQENVGLAVALSYAEQPLREFYAGHALLESEIAVSAKTRFLVMSITKAFVGAALIKTSSAGLVELDRPISLYLGDFPAADRITLRQLAAHTAGLPHLGHPDRKALYVEHFATATEALTTFRELPPLSAPGSEYHYSSAGYTLIAAVLEAVHKKPFAAVLKDLILDPLELSDTGPGNVLRPVPNLARNYSWIDIWTYEPSPELQLVPTWDFSFNPGGGNLVTTARDLVKFGRAFVKPGFFSEAELAHFMTRIDEANSRWSFGWFVSESDSGEVSLSISGATPGVQAGLRVHPQRQLVMATLANAWGKNSAGGDLVVGAPGRVVADLTATEGQ